jgi:hypothetical protein
MPAVKVNDAQMKQLVAYLSGLGTAPAKKTDHAFRGRVSRLQQRLYANRPHRSRQSRSPDAEEVSFHLAKHPVAILRHLYGVVGEK